MDHSIVIGVDIAKNYLQIHVQTLFGQLIKKKRVKRDNFLNTLSQYQPCLVGMEACGGAHYWAKQLIGLGFEVKLMNPSTVKKFASHQKNDANDAKTCADVVTRADSRFVAIKTQEQISQQQLIRVRELYVKRCTGLMNTLRGLLTEFGVAIKQGQSHLIDTLKTLIEPDNTIINGYTKSSMADLYEDLIHTIACVDKYTKQIAAVAKENELCQRLQTINGVGPLTAVALFAKIGNGSDFRNGRELSAYLGLVPRQHSSGDKVQLRGISKRGDRHIRRLLVSGAQAAIQSVLRIDKETGVFKKQDRHSEWIRQLLSRCTTNKVAVAIANKNARLVIGLLKSNQVFSAELAHM